MTVTPSEVRRVVRASPWAYMAGLLVVAGLYADGWAHNHLVRDVGWWGTFPSRPGPPHFPAGLSLWHLPYLAGLAWSGMVAAVRARTEPDGAQQARRLAAVGLATAGWVVATLTAGARTPTPAVVRLESLPGLVGPGALMQAGGIVYLGWSLLDRGGGGRWARVVAGLVVLSTLTFLTQFAHPYVDPWPSAGFLRTGLQTYRYGSFYFGEAMGVLSLWLQALLVAGVVVAVWRAGGLPPGGWTMLFGANGLLMATLRDHYLFSASALLTGLVTDLLASRVRDPRELPMVTGCTAGAFCASVFLAVGQMGAVDVLYGTGGGFALPQVGGLGWSVPLWAGTTLLAGGCGWLVAFLGSPARWERP
ncbi:MAG: hypothetical protein RMM30_07390 [Armatimonadota bacterium]|nr:hypothetical protein [Armatimonadota bacterium]MDW8156390.1 hypothetical protein [Armatimonadota bacterium]